MRVMKKTFFIVLFVLAFLAFGSFIKISPPDFLLQQFPSGKKIDLYEKYGEIIRIYGTDVPLKYQLISVKPSEMNIKITGFYDIPDLDWFSFEDDKVKVPVNGEKLVKIFLKVPADDNYYNRHYFVAASVSPAYEKDDYGSLLMGAILQFRFETLPKADVIPEVSPGEIVFVPSIVEFKDVEVGKEYLYKLKIYSSDEKPTKYTLSTLDPQSDVGRITIERSKGCFRIPPDSSWLYYDSTYTIQKDKPVDLYLTLFLKNQPKYFKHEQILLLEGPTKGFVRILIDVKNPYR